MATFPPMMWCVKCGVELDLVDRRWCSDMNYPAACPTCFREVMFEASRVIPVWPKDWKGGSWKNTYGRWHYEKPYPAHEE